MSKPLLWSILGGAAVLVVVLLGVVMLQQQKQTSYLSNQAYTTDSPGIPVVGEQEQVPPAQGAAPDTPPRNPNGNRSLVMLCGVVRVYNTNVEDSAKGVAVRARWSGFSPGQQGQPVSGTIRLENFRYVDQIGEDQPIDAVQTSAEGSTPNLFPISSTLQADGTTTAIGSGLIVHSGFHWGQNGAADNIPNSGRFLADVRIEDTANSLSSVYPAHSFTVGNEATVNQFCGL